MDSDPKLRMAKHELEPGSKLRSYNRLSMTIIMAANSSKGQPDLKVLVFLVVLTTLEVESTTYLGLIELISK